MGLQNCTLRLGRIYLQCKSRGRGGRAAGHFHRDFDCLGFLSSVVDIKATRAGNRFSIHGCHVIE
jgi:hypothetical protein